MTNLCEWQDGPDRHGDPIEDWLRETAEPGGQADPNTWRPELLVVRAPSIQLLFDRFDLKSGREDFSAKLIEASAAELLTFSLHDWSHFLNMLVQGPAELIFWVNETKLAVTKKTDAQMLASILFGTESLPDGAEIVRGGAAISAASVHPPGQGLVQGLYLEAITQWIGSPAEPAVETLDSHLVVTGVIDYGIGIANEVFRQSATETRVQAVWDQQAAEADNPSTVIGRVVRKCEIDMALSDLKDEILQDEIGVYERLGLINLKTPSTRRGDQPLRLRQTHGTAMLDLAAGSPEGSLAPGLHPSFAVNLPPELVARTNGFLHELYVKSAMNWIWFEALSQYGNLHRLVVNYSFGDYSGRHDGQDLLDADFQRRIAREELGMVTIPAGNGYIEDIHAHATYDELVSRYDSEIELDLYVQPDDKTATFVQLWLDETTVIEDTEPFPLAITVETPTGNHVASSAKVFGKTHDLTCDGDILARVYYQIDYPGHLMADPDHTPTPRVRWTLALRPSASDRLDFPVVEPGRWKLKISPAPRPVAWQGFSLWVERGDTIAGFPARGRQARLDHEAHQRWTDSGWRPEEDADDCPIKRLGTLSGHANASLPLAAAAYRKQNDCRLAIYSAARSVETEPWQPSLAMSAEDSSARRNILTTGTLSGSIWPTNGTSAAAALAAGALSERLRVPEHGTWTGRQAKADLQAGLTLPIPRQPLHPEPPQFPAERIGKGLKVRLHRPYAPARHR